MKVLVQLPNWVGDVVMATPALRAVRAGFEGAEVVLLGRPHLLSMLEGAPWFDRAIPLAGKGGPLAPLIVGRALRAERFDLALVLPNSWSSAITALVAAIPRRLGYAVDGRGVLLTRSLPVMRVGRLRPVPMTAYYLELARLAGCPADRTGARLELPVTPEREERADSWFRAHAVAPGERPIALSVGASFGPAKRWTVQGWAAVAEHFLEAGRSVVLHGGPGDRAEVEAVLARIRRPGAIAALDVPLKDLVCHVRRSSLLITTDSGVRHFGVAAGIPVVVVMGPTHPNYTEVDYDRYAVLLEKVECWPCHLRDCPIDHRCMSRIRPERVIWAAESFLAGRHPFGGARPWLTEPGREHTLFRGGAT